MASTGLAIPPFKKDKQFLDGIVDLSIDVTAPITPEVAKSLAANTVFPPGSIKLGTIATAVSGGAGDLQFGGATGAVVSFRGSASGGGGIGVYSTSVEMLRDVA